MKNNGGFVYPIVVPTEFMDVVDGITRRDWLAGLAMQALISGPINITAEIGQSQEVSLQVKAYKLADAMIAEGEK